MTSERPASDVRLLIEPALNYSGNAFSWHDVLDRVASGKAKIWNNGDAAGVTEVLNFPQKRVCNVWLAGGRMESLLSMLDDVLVWAKENNCSEVTVQGRKGWQRILPGFSMRNVELVRAI